MLRGQIMLSYPKQLDQCKTLDKQNFCSYGPRRGAITPGFQYETQDDKSDLRSVIMCLWEILLPSDSLNAYEEKKANCECGIYLTES